MSTGKRPRSRTFVLAVFASLIAGFLIESAKIWFSDLPLPSLITDLQTIEFWKSFGVSTAIAMSLLSLLIVLILIIVKVTISLVERKSKKILELENQLAYYAGLYFYAPNEEPSHEQKSLIEEIKKTHAKEEELSVLCASGRFTFTHEKAVLSKSLIQEQKIQQLTVVLLNPGKENKAVIQRSTYLKIDPKEYRKEIVKTVDTLKDLSSKNGIRIRVYFYNHRPFWKLIINRNHVWVQRYETSSEICDSPVFGFREQRCMTTFVQYYKDFFNRRIEHLEKIDLKSWTPPSDL